MKFLRKILNLGHISIKKKVVVFIGTMLALSLFFMTLIVVFIVKEQINVQTYNLLKSKTYSASEHLEQRLNYLVENTRLLSTNELVINALTDYEGRDKYLPSLIDNFIKGKDVISLDVVDFDGKPVFETQRNTPKYNESSQLRTALAMGELAFYIQDVTKQLVLFAPIKYYNTTQGAIVVVFDIKAIAKDSLTIDKSAYFKLISNNETLFVDNYDSSVSYRTYEYVSDKQTPICNELNIVLDIGLPESVYNKPVKDAITLLSIVGIVFVLLGIFYATTIANAITQPIIELYNRVKASDKNSNILCSPLGTHDELEELAGAFDERTLKLQYQAQHDLLTDLPNKLLFIDRLRQSIKALDRSKEKIAVLFIDIDRFKEVNDSFGHDFGDELLRVVANKIGGAIRSFDSIARVGGDEFIVFLDNISNDDTIIDIVQRIMNIFKESFVLKNQQFFITCSIGIAVYPVHGETHEALLKNADAAMYKAKDEGRNTYRFYTDDMTKKAYERVTLEAQLRKALKNEEFEVYYQSQVDMRTKKISGMEALIRWNHPTQGLIPPYKFIPLAEETGMIVEIDRWVMKSAMKQFVQWQQDGHSIGTLSLNLSMIQLNHEDFIDVVKALMEESNISAESLIFEVTETQIMRNPEKSIVMLNQLKRLGVALAMDDFGTGYSSLSYLKKLPIDKIKVDQSFVRDIPHDIDDVRLTRAIIAISQSLKLKIIAEGVETQDQAEFLQENGCFEAQGYFYFKPQDSHTLTKVLKSF